MGIPIGPHDDSVSGLQAQSGSGLQAWSREKAFGLDTAPGEFVQHFDVGTARGQHPNGLDTPGPCVVPPVVDQFGHGVDPVAADVDPAGFGVVEHGSIDISPSQLVEGVPVEVVVLSLIGAGQVGDDSVAVSDDAMEQTAGVDRGQLVWVAEEDQLAVIAVSRTRSAASVRSDEVAPSGNHEET